MFNRPSKVLMLSVLASVLLHTFAAVSIHSDSRTTAPDNKRLLIHLSEPIKTVNQARPDKDAIMQGPVEPRLSKVVKPMPQYQPIPLESDTVLEDSASHIRQVARNEVHRRLDDFEPGVMAFNGASKYWSQVYDRCVNHLIRNTRAGQLFHARSNGLHNTPEGWKQYQPTFEPEQLAKVMNQTRRQLESDREWVLERSRNYVSKRLSAASELLGAPVELHSMDDQALDKLQAVSKNQSNAVLASRAQEAILLIRSYRGLDAQATEQMLYAQEEQRLLERAENNFYITLMNKEAQAHLDEREGACVPLADKARSQFLKEALAEAESIKTTRRVKL